MQELKAKVRMELGRGVKELRKKGLMPAVVYGEGLKTKSISLQIKDFEKTHRIAGESALIKLRIEDSETKKSEEYNVLIHDIASHPLKGHPLHADLYAVRMDKILRTKIPLMFTGESPAVKNEGGVLVKVVHELEIEALPKDLPHELKIDISPLETLEQKLFVKDIQVPPGVKILASAEEVVVLVEAPRSQEELESLKEAPVAAPVEEVKTEQEVKKEEKAKQETEEEVPRT